MKNLKKYLTKNLDRDCILSCFEQINSTNDFLLNQPSIRLPHICISNHQTHGKGQHGRVWQSAKNSSLLLSLKYPFSADTDLSGLSLMVGLSIVNTLKQHFKITHCEQLQIKWPNDIYYQAKKLAGILIENQVQGSDINSVIGMGINIALPDDFSCDSPFIDLKTILRDKPNKASFCLLIIEQLLTDIATFEQNRFMHFLPQWRLLDYLYQAKITLMDKTTYQANGVNYLGGLQLVGKESCVLYDSSRIKEITIG